MSLWTSAPSRQHHLESKVQLPSSLYYSCRLCIGQSLSIHPERARTLPCSRSQPRVAFVHHHVTSTRLRVLTLAHPLTRRAMQVRRASALGVGAGLGSHEASDGAYDSESDVDEAFLSRTLQQLAKRERSLPSLRVQLGQAERMRDVESTKLPTAGARIAQRRKWASVATSLRAAITLLAPADALGLELHAIPALSSANPNLDYCLIDGWLQRRGDRAGAVWRRHYYCLKVEGLLYFNDVQERAPCGQLPVDASTRSAHAEFAYDGAASGDALRCFTLFSGGRSCTLCCESGGAGEAQRWIDAIGSLALAHAAGTRTA